MLKLNISEEVGESVRMDVLVSPLLRLRVDGFSLNDRMLTPRIEESLACREIEPEKPF